jgi:hypothetical protein
MLILFIVRRRRNPSTSNNSVESRLPKPETFVLHQEYKHLDRTKSVSSVHSRQETVSVVKRHMSLKDSSSNLSGKMSSAASSSTKAGGSKRKSRVVSSRSSLIDFNPQRATQASMISGYFKNIDEEEEDDESDEVMHTVKVLHGYTPTLSDELHLEPGMMLQVLKMFDDGWGLGCTPHNGVQGAFPLICISEDVGKASDDVEKEMKRNSTRVTSLAISSRVGSMFFGGRESLFSNTGLKESVLDVGQEKVQEEGSGASSSISMK